MVLFDRNGIITGAPPASPGHYTPFGKTKNSTASGPQNALSPSLAILNKDGTVTYAKPGPPGTYTPMNQTATDTQATSDTSSGSPSDLSSQSALLSGIEGALGSPDTSSQQNVSPSANETQPITNIHQQNVIERNNVREHLADLASKLGFHRQILDNYTVQRDAALEAAAKPKWKVGESHIVGHYDPYLDNRLKVTSSNQPAANDNATSTSDGSESHDGAGGTTLIANASLPQTGTASVSDHSQDNLPSLTGLPPGHWDSRFSLANGKTQGADYVLTNPDKWGNATAGFIHFTVDTSTHKWMAPAWVNMGFSSQQDLKQQLNGEMTANHIQGTLGTPFQVNGEWFTTVTSVTNDSSTDGIVSILGNGYVATLNGKYFDWGTPWKPLSQADNATAGAQSPSNNGAAANASSAPPAGATAANSSASTTSGGGSSVSGYPPFDLNLKLSARGSDPAYDGKLVYYWADAGNQADSLKAQGFVTSGNEVLVLGTPYEAQNKMPLSSAGYSGGYLWLLRGDPQTGKTMAINYGQNVGPAMNQFIWNGTNSDGNDLGWRTFVPA